MVPEYFANNGHAMPTNYNPADWIMNVAQSVDIKQLDKDGFFPEDERPVEEAFGSGKDVASHDALGITKRSNPDEDDEDFDDRPVSTVTEVRMLFRREVTHFRRDTDSLFAKYVLTLVLGVLIGVIFLDVGVADITKMSNVQSRFGALIICMMMSMYGTAEDALLGFPAERPVFLREYSTNHYGVVSYVLSKMCVEAIVIFTQNLLFVSLSYESRVGDLFH